MLSIKVDGCRKRGRLKKIWLDYVINYTHIKSLNTEMTSGRVEWKNNTYCADPA